MFNLALQIEYLLLHHDCVVLPGFGAFINVRHAARYDAAEGIWYPMSREVRFNGALTHDDGLLANSYARKNRVSFHEGRDLLRADIDKLRRGLTNDGELTIGNLGILRLSEGTVSFLPMYDAASLARMLGFVAVPAHVEAIAAKPAEKEVPIRKEPAKVERTSGEGRFDTDRNYYIPVNKIFARVAACFLLTVVVALWLIQPGSHSKQIDQASVLPIENIVMPMQEEEPVVSEPEGPRHYAIVGTFRTETEARDFMAMHSTGNYDMKVLEGKRLWRVSAASSANRDELLDVMRSESFRGEFSEAWIWNE